MGWEMMLRAVLSLLLVFGLIAGAGLLVRRFSLQGGLLTRRSPQRRLAVLESLPLDNRRRLVLVRKDKAEHLLLLGGGADLLLESAAMEHAPFTLDPPPPGDLA